MIVTLSYSKRKEDRQTDRKQNGKIFTVYDKQPSVGIADLNPVDLFVFTLRSKMNKSVTGDNLIGQFLKRICSTLKL